MLDDPTVIIVIWTVTDEKVTKLSLEFQEGGEGGWAPVIGASDMRIFTTELKVENLKHDRKYRFRLDMRRTGEDSPSYVESNIGRSGSFINLLFLTCKEWINIRIFSTEDRSRWRQIVDTLCLTRDEED